jgi:hypothetical protein
MKFKNISQEYVISISPRKESLNKTLPHVKNIRAANIPEEYPNCFLTHQKIVTQ